MPPRKHVEAQASGTNGADDDTPGRGQIKNRDGVGIEDLTLPKTMVQRLAKGMLPANTQIQKDALLAIHKSATVFVSYLANSANDRAVLLNKKTIQPKDVMEALAELEFEDFLPRCEGELVIYNKMQCTKRNDYRKRVKETREHASESAILEAAESRASRNGVGGTTNGHGVRGQDSAPAAKKARISLIGATNGVAHDEDDEGDETVDDEEVEEENEEQSDVEEEDEADDDDEEQEEDEGDGDEGGDGDGEGGEDAEDSLETDKRRSYGTEEDDDAGSDSE